MSSLDKKLTTKNIISILEYLKAEPKLESSGNISSKTVCHNGIGNGSRKLIYYNNSKLFVCYTGCEEDFFGATELVKKALNTDLYNAITIIENLTGVYDDYISPEIGFKDENEDLTNEDLEYIKNNTFKEEKLEVTKYDKKLLNSFYPLYHKSFIDDNITKETMKKFNLKFDIDKNRIIIPHYYHEDGSLVSIRCRNLNQELIDMGLKYTPIRMNVKNKNCSRAVAISSKTGAYLFGLLETLPAIKSNKIVILFESEKSVMQMDSYFGDRNCSVATMGSFLSHRQIEILIETGAEEVVIAYDKEFKVYGDKEDKLYRKKLRKRLIEKLLPHFKVSVIYDRQGLLNYKDSPSDHGKKVFLKLFKNRFYIKG